MMMTLMKRSVFLSLLGVSFTNGGWAAPSGLTFDTGLAITSNANLVQTNPESDAIAKVGGAWRFPFVSGNSRLSIRYSDYFTHHENDLLSGDLSHTWKAENSSGATALTYGLRLQTRNYVKQDAGTTDQGFTHHGMGGNITFNPTNPFWSFTPKVDFEYYPSARRSDFDLSLNAEYDSLVSDADQGFTFGFTPGILYSTASDFSKAYLALSADYEAPLSETSTWGSGLWVTPSFYLSRATTSTALTPTRRKRGAASTLTTLVSKKEITCFFSPSVWYSKILSSDWLTRIEILGNFQTSKSGTYNYTEFVVLASLQYRVF